MFDGTARARVDSTGIQVIDVTVDHGYRPEIIHALPGLPLRLLFHRNDASECTERVVFSTPRLERHLTLAGTTVIDLPAQDAGEIRFTCGMGRFVGRIELIGAPRPILVRLARQLRQLQTPLGTALVLWIGSLPLIALAAILALDSRAALIAAGAALIAWVAGCVWVFGAHGWRLRRP